MAIIFEKSPIAEAILEVRWLPKGMPPAIAGTQLMFALQTNPASVEEYLQRFGAVVAKDGFSRTERLSPVNMPVLLHQPLMRFRPADPADGTRLLQAGGGILTANAVRPYKSWAQYKETISTGLNAILASRPDEEKDSPFASLNLRYINSFTKDFSPSGELDDFISKVLGIKLSMPPAWSSHVKEGASQKMRLSLMSEMKNDLRMTINVAEGSVFGQLGIILDSSALVENIPADVDVVIRKLDEMHDVMESIFLDATKSIHDLMLKKVGS